MLCQSPRGTAAEEYLRREPLAQELKVTVSPPYHIAAMCASFVYKRRKPPSSPIQPAQVNENGVVNGGGNAVSSSSAQPPTPVNADASQPNGRPNPVDPTLTSSDDDHLRPKLPAYRARRLTLLGIGAVDFCRASSSDDCSSSSSVHPLLGSPSSPSFHMACKKCGMKSNPLRMLICDLCDEAFHLGCCKARRLPEDEWYCRPCQRKKPKVLPETLSGQLFYIMRQRRKRRLLREKLGPIMAMLVDADLYSSAVRIGKKFQAEVPDWDGPLPDSDAYLASASELPPTDWWSLKASSLKTLFIFISIYISAFISTSYLYLFLNLVCMFSIQCHILLLTSSPLLHASQTTSLRQYARRHSIGNWVQCREMIYNEADEDDEGTICGKWRRAPLFVSQTEDWDCSCALPWDPVHADCAVPQELETAKITKHLDYIDSVVCPSLSPSLAKSMSQGLILTVHAAQGTAARLGT
ncbi:uncharacterized protein LOC144712674 [Wolffia australiana]